MKICIPVTGPEGLQAALQPDFTAAEHILVYNLQTGEHRTFSRDGEEQADEEPISVDAVLCADMHPQVLRAFAAQGIQVFATAAETVASALQALQQGEAEELVAVGGCCGGGHHAHEEDHECCGGHGHADDHECCGGAGHGHVHGDDHECCGGKGHAHAHGEDHECCGGQGHADDHECCGGQGHGHAKADGCKG